MEVFPQLGQNQFDFKVEYDKLPEKIQKHLTVRAGSGLVEPRMNFCCIWESRSNAYSKHHQPSCSEVFLWSLETSTPQGSAQELHASLPACPSSSYKPIMCCRCQDMRTQLLPRRGKSRGPRAEIKQPL